MLMINFSDKLCGLGTADQGLYGLYAPIVDRFIVVNYDHEVLSDVRSIISSKIYTVVVDLTNLNNYCHNIIDNNVCLGWTMGPCQIDRVLFNREFDHDLEEISLIGHPRSYREDLKFLQIFAVQAMSLVMAWKKIKNMTLESLVKTIYPDMHLTLNALEILKFHDVPDDDLQTNAESPLIHLDISRAAARDQCYRSLYWAKNTDEVKNMIESLALSENPVEVLFHESYHGWFR